MGLFDTFDHAALPLDVKAAQGGVVQGYASLFGETDTGGDMVMQGASFASAIMS